MSQGERAKKDSQLRSAYPVFGAFSAAGELLLVVEAGHADLATSRVAQVAVLVSPSAEHPLRVTRLDSAPGGIPIFFDAYFEDDDASGVLSRIGPSSRSFQ